MKLIVYRKASFGMTPNAMDMFPEIQPTLYVEVPSYLLRKIYSMLY
jgi:hypothetical protein